MVTLTEIKEHQNLPIDMIESEILPRLPAKTVARCMCVCKRWHSLLSTQDFRRKNLRYITTNKPQTHQKLLIVKAPRCRKIPTLATPEEECDITRFIPFIHDNGGMMILASLDGLVCVAVKSPFALTFWNPLTGEYKMLSKSHVHSFSKLYKDTFGLYSDSSNDYKILHLVRKKENLDSSDSSHVYIYSRRLDSWRQIFTFNYAEYLLWPKYHWSPGTFLGQNLYFTVVSKQNSCIICFDVVSEQFREINFPREVSVSVGFNGTLVVMSGCIHLCVPRENIDRMFYVPFVNVDLWRMDRDGEGWMKVVTYSGNENIPLTLTPNCIVRHGNWDVTWVFNKAIGLFDTTNIRLENKATYRGESYYDIVRVLYIETLVSPNS